MKYYAGLEVSLKGTAICIIDDTEKIMKEARAASEPDALIKALQKIAFAARSYRS